VLLAVECEQGDRQPFCANGVGHHARLIRRHDLILETLKKDERARQPVNEMNRRSRLVDLLLRRIRSDESVQIP
jgi:hypothetical protein